MGDRGEALQRTLSSYSRILIMHALQNAAELSIDALREVCELHPNTVREHVHRLIDDGFVLSRSEPREQRGRPKVLYRAAQGTEAHETILAAKARLAHERSEIVRRVMPDVPAAIGEKSVVRQLDALDDHLDQAGFDPIIDQRNRCIDLTRCPFAEMVLKHQRVVCDVHFGLISAVLVQADGPLRAKGLLPFVESDRCRVELTVVGDEVAHDRMRVAG